MKTRTPALVTACLLAAGCTTVYSPQGDKQRIGTSEHTVVNNTPFNLDVNINGAEVYKAISPGQVVPIRPGFLSTATVVVVTAHDGNGQYVGAATSTFHLNVPRAWVVSSTQ